MKNEKYFPDVIELMELSHIKRWHMVDTIRTQSVAEHSFNVAVLTKHICLELGLESTTAVTWALIHDITELKTGDIATTAKDKIHIDDTGLYGVYDLHLESFASDYEKSIVKIADLIDAIYFITRNAIHSPKAKIIYIDLISRFRDEYKALRTYLPNHDNLHTITEMLTDLTSYDSQLEFWGKECV